MNLREKEEYYRYERPPKYKNPPTLNPELAALMLRTGLDKTYRFLWSGVCVERKAERDDHPIIRGDARACEVNLRRIDNAPIPWLEPRYLYVRSKQLKGFAYEEMGTTVRTTRQESIPAGRLFTVEYVYYDFGILRWQLEQRTPERVRAELGEHDDASDDGWTWIMTCQTVRGTYYEPGLEMMEVLEKREDQNRNADLKQVAAAQMEATAKRERDRAEKADDELRQFSQMISAEVEKHAAALPHSVS